MAKSDFIDEVKFFVRSGNGGAGSRHFRRERHVPKGGPDGGDGGNGGSVIFEGNSHLRTLLDFRYRKHFFASSGQHGAGNHRTGASGQDLILPVPLGTVIEDKNGHILGEILLANQRCIVAKGGKGGLGNAHFKRATNQSPYYAQPGQQGEERMLRLVLKLVGDVSLVGLPNAGKSTLLSVMSAARPQIGAYPFTTLVPKVGVVYYQPTKSFVMVDMPGIIQGASQGKGLGLRFLKHIERAKMLLILLPADDEDIIKTYHVLHNELQHYDPRLLDKKRVLLITKVDLVSEKHLAKIKALLPTNLPIAFVSAQQEKGLAYLKRLLWEQL